MPWKPISSCTHCLMFAAILAVGCADEDSGDAGPSSSGAESGTTETVTTEVGTTEAGSTEVGTAEAGTTEASGEGTQGDSTSDMGAQSQRGVRICELNELFISEGSLSLRVWNDVGLHDCPDEWLAAIDPDMFAVGGPRWRSADEVTPISGTPDLGRPQEIPAGLGQQMVEAAVVQLLPLTALEGQLGVTIANLDDIPIEVRRMILGNTLYSTGYAVAEVEREFSTEFVHYAGQRVFVLDDGECQYAMKYYTSIVDEDLVDEDAIATLGDRFTALPPGYSFSVETFEEDLVIVEDNGVQFVMTDEFGNSYDRFACD